jgi:hypothetical protein
MRVLLALLVVFAGCDDDPDDCDCPEGEGMVVRAGTYDVSPGATERTNHVATVDHEEVVFTYDTPDGSRWRVTYRVSAIVF